MMCWNHAVILHYRGVIYYLLKEWCSVTAIYQTSNSWVRLSSTEMINCFNFFVESRHANLLFITMSKWFSQIFTQLDFLTSCARGGFPGCRVQFLFHTFPQVLRNLHNKILKHIPLFCLRHSQATTPRFAQYNWVITLSSKIVPWWFLWNKTCKRLRKFWGWGIQEYLLRRSIIRNMHFLRKWGKIYISCNGAAVCKHHNTSKFH